MRKGGLEPPRSCDRQPLKLVRLPIPPLPQADDARERNPAPDRSYCCGEEFVGRVAGTAGCGAGRWYSRGDQAARVGDWDTAVEYYRRAVQAKPERTDYRIALERGQLEKSAQRLTKAAELDPKLAEAHYFHGIVLQRWKQFQPNSSAARI